MRPWYRFCLAAAGAILRLFGPMRVVGASNLPRDRNFILASNHYSFLEPPILAVAGRLEVHFLAKSALFRIPVLGPLIRSLNSIPINRGSADVTGLNAAVEVLRQDPYTAAELAQIAPPPPQKPKPSPPRNPSARTEVQDAVEAFNADHPGDWPRSGGECPACGHKGCFNAHPNNPDRWCCHSSNHGGCGLPPAPGKGSS